MNVKNLAKIRSLFFDNVNVRQTVFKNTAWLAVAEGITQLLNLFLVIYIARILGATDYGKFTFALSFACLFLILSDFGLSKITTREFSQNKKREKEFSSVLSLKILLSSGALGLIILISFFITTDPAIRKIIWILGPYILITNFLDIFYAFLRARQQMQYEASIKIFRALIIALVGFLVLFNFPSVENLSYGYLLSCLIVLIFTLFIFHFKFYSLKISWQKPIWKKFLIMSWPMGLAAFFITLYNNIDSVMLGYWGQIIETGWYNGARKIIEVTLIPMLLISHSFYPALSKFFRKSKTELQRAWNYYMEIMIFLALPLAIGGIVLAPRIINFIYGAEFDPSVLAFQILIITAGFSFIATPFRYLLIAVHEQKKIFSVVLLGAILNILLNLILIPRYSLYGAAFTTLITIIFTLFLFWGLTVKFTPIKILNLKSALTLMIGLFSSFIMYLVISYPMIYNLNIFTAILIGALIYFIAFFFSKNALSFLQGKKL